MPDDDELAARLTEVLTVIYLLFNEGYLATRRAGPVPRPRRGRGMPRRLLHQLMPTEPEVAGLLALIRLHRARAAARFGADGGLVPLPIRTGPCGTARPSRTPVRLLTRAAGRSARAVPAPGGDRRLPRRGGALGGYRLGQIVLLYDMLLHLAPSPVTRLHRAIAAALRLRAAAAMAEWTRWRAAGRLPPVPRHPRRVAP